MDPVLTARAQIGHARKAGDVAAEQAAREALAAAEQAAREALAAAKAERAIREGLAGEPGITPADRARLVALLMGGGEHATT